LSLGAIAEFARDADEPASPVLPAWPARFDSAGLEGGEDKTSLHHDC
jgi:hypothetical protein